MYRVRKVNLSEIDDFCLTGPGLGMEKWICPKMMIFVSICLGIEWEKWICPKLTIFVWQVQVYKGKMNLYEIDDFCPTSPGMRMEKWICPKMAIFIFWQV